MPRPRCAHEPRPYHTLKVDRLAALYSTGEPGGEPATQAPTYFAQAQAWLKDVQQALLANTSLSLAVNALTGQALASLQAAVPALLQFPLTLLSGAFGALISAVVVVTMSIFWLMSADKLRDFSLGLAPERARADGASLFTELGHTLGGWVRGTLVAMLLIGSLTALGLALLGVPYALLLGILAGLTEVIPYLGPWISGTVAVIVTLLALDPLKALEVAVVFVIIQEVESNLVEPFVMSWAVHIDPLFVLIAITIGFEVLGVVGAIIAVPVAGMAQVLMQRVVAPAIRRATTTGTKQAATLPRAAGEVSASFTAKSCACSAQDALTVKDTYFHVLDLSSHSQRDE